jgi:hypothetical protein
MVSKLKISSNKNFNDALNFIKKKNAYIKNQFHQKEFPVLKLKPLIKTTRNFLTLTTTIKNK